MWLSVQSLSHVQLFVTPWTAARQASLSITNSPSLLKPMSIELVMPSNYLILCRPILFLPSIFPSIRVFSNESVLHISGQSTGASSSASVLPITIQDWFPLGWTGLISLLKGYLIHNFNGHFLHLFFWLMAYYLPFIFILDLANVRQKANLSDFLIQVQNGS